MVLVDERIEEIEGDPANQEAVDLGLLRELSIDRPLETLERLGA